MEIKKTAVAGTMESSDIMITIAPNEGNGIHIDLNSTVGKQFGAQIRESITSTLTGLGIDNADVKAVDRGALECAIKARVAAAAFRACESTEYTWA